MRRPKQHIQKIIEKRKMLWPDLSPDELWDRRAKSGFTTVPRTLPYILSIIDDLTKGQPASSVYLALWMRAYDEMYVNVSNREEYAHFSGYFGQRAIQTWQIRMRSLANLGFIKIKEGLSGVSHAVIINPHIVLERLSQARTPGFQQKKYELLKEFAIDIKADDVGKDPRP